MRSELGETFRVLNLTGQITGRSETSAVVDFGDVGFLTVVTDCEGANQTIINIVLPDWMLDKDAIAEIKRTVISFFDLHPADRFLIKTCVPLNAVDQRRPTQPFVAELVSFGPSAYGRPIVGAPPRPPGPIARYFSDAVAGVSQEEVYSVPRRYDLAAMFAISVAYALLFAMLIALDTPPSVIMFSGIFFTAVGISQAVLFGGEKPREASVIAGFVTGPFLVIMFSIVQGMPPAIATASATCAVVCGPICGYLAGTTIGGIWLVADYLRKWVESRQATSSDRDSN